jgi:hypothetical protein
MSLPEAHSDFSFEMSCLVSTHLVKVSRVASMMGAVSLVTFIAGAFGVATLVAAGAFVWAETVGVKWKRQNARKKGRKFIVKNST